MVRSFILTVLRTRRSLLVLVLTGVSIAFVAMGTGHSATLFGLTDTGELFASSDGGVTWSIVSTLPIYDSAAIAAGETSNELYLSSRAGVIYRSADAGANWVAAGAVPAPDIVDMAIRTNGDVFLLSETGTLWRSQDDGATFNAIATLTASNFVSLTGDTGGGRMYALTQTGEVSRSTDFGTTWNTVGTVATSEAVDIRAIGQTLYLLTGSGDVARSTDNGGVWMMVGTASHVHMTSLTRYQEGLAAMTREGLVARSSDDAMTWSFVGSVNQTAVVAAGNDDPTITGIPGGPPSLQGLRIRTIWPNPVGSRAGSVEVSFDLPAAASVSVETYNVLGQLVTRNAPTFYDRPGEQLLSLDVRSLRSGTYYVRLVMDGGVTAEKRLTVVR